MRAETTSEKPTARLNLVQSLSEYIKDVRIEMSKVSWPSRTELRESTLVVIVMVFLIAAFIGVVDKGLLLAFEAFIRVLG